AGLLALVRPPNVFTAVADSAAGLLLARRAGPLAGDPGLWCLAASTCLYLGGIALNDYFDRHVDAVERPERPIPSGAVPPAVAAGLGAVLLAAGIVLAGLAGGSATTVAAVLAPAIVLYAAVCQGTDAGFPRRGPRRGGGGAGARAAGAARGGAGRTDDRTRDRRRNSDDSAVRRDLRRRGGPSPVGVRGRVAHVAGHGAPAHV